MVLAGLSGASPLATDMYVPALPDLACSLATDASGAQMSLTGFLAGIIVGQLVLGPLSDAVGRRPVLIGGSVLFAAFSTVCAAAHEHRTGPRGCLPSCAGPAAPGRERPRSRW
ncbi:MFS transporter [Streptomyces decoyicus]|nr:MFS transporter [Streptomyces decoyicus]